MQDFDHERLRALPRRGNAGRRSAGASANDDDVVLEGRATALAELDVVGDDVTLGQVVAKVGDRFTLGVVAAAYALSLLWHSKSVFDLAIWCFTGFTALTPLVIAAIYWKRVTLSGAYACVGVTVILGIYLFSQSEWGDNRRYLVEGLKPVAPLTLASVAALIFVSLLTNPPAKETLRKFFPSDNQHSNNKQQKSSKPREQKRGTDRRQNHGNRNRRGRRPRNQD